MPKNQRAVAAEIKAQRQAMDEETARSGLDPVRNDEVSRLKVVANERDPETGGNYSERALAAQRKLADVGVDPRPRTRQEVLTMSNVIDNPRPDKSARQPKVKNLKPARLKVRRLPSGVRCKGRGR